MPGDINGPSLESIVARFQYDISEQGPDTTYSLPDFSEAINHNMKYVQIGQALTKGIYLGDGLLRDDMEYGFFLQPGNRLTREDSHNKVFFGSVLLLPQGPLSEIHTQVAVKSRPLHEASKLYGEMALFQRLGKLGLRTFENAGLVVGDEAVHLMTYFEGNVATMDTIDWSMLDSDEAWFELDKVVDTMMQLHAEALFHGDLEFRNVAFDQKGSTVIIDPELMVSAGDAFNELLGSGFVLTPDQSRHYEAVVRKLSSEMSNVFKSIDTHIVPLLPKHERPRTDEARLKLYKRRLLEPYKERIKDYDDPLRSLLLRLADEVLARKKQYAKDGKL